MVCSMPEIRLCHQLELDDPGSRGFELTLADESRLSLFVVQLAGQCHAYQNRCPHTGAPLEWRAHQFLDLEQQYIQCAMHGALFEVATGYCLRGPCSGQSLRSLALENRDGELYLVDVLESEADTTPK